MLTMFRKNFKLSDITARILFVLFFALSRWQTALGVTVALWGTSNWLLAICILLLLGTAFMFLMPFLVNLLLNVAKIVSVPRAEFCLWAHVFCALGFLLLGILNLVNLFTPLLLTWGGIIFPFVATVAASAGFYAVTSKLYFNNLTRAHYFRMFCIYTLIFVVIFEV